MFYQKIRAMFSLFLQKTHFFGAVGSDGKIRSTVLLSAMLSAEQSTVFLMTQAPNRGLLKSQTQFLFGWAVEDFMGQVSKIILIREVAFRVGLSIPSIRRYLQESRAGLRNFPLTISPPGCKCRWRASDIEAYLASLSAAPPVASSTRQVAHNQKEFHQRQLAAEKALEKHRKSGK